LQNQKYEISLEMRWLSPFSLLAIMSLALSRIDYNADCLRALQSRGLVKRWWDDSGNLRLQEFHLYTLRLMMDNKEPGEVTIFPALACLPQERLSK